MIIPFILLMSILFLGVFQIDIHSIGSETAIIGGKNLSNDTLLISNQALVLITVVLTALIVLYGVGFSVSNRNLLCLIGKRSYSIFVWHQVVLALYRYSISPQLTAAFVVWFVTLTVILSELSYHLLEKRVNTSNKSVIITAITAVCVCGFSALIYLNAGVVRDVPELGISRDNVHRNMHAEYCDRVYKYDAGFEENGKTNILVIGNSFARDFGNIVLESGYDVNLSYASTFAEEKVDRFTSADKVFVFGGKDDIPQWVWDNSKVVYGIGTKNFGHTNGNIYSQRFSKDYFNQTIELDEGYRRVNEQLKSEWGSDYIDLIAAVTNPDGTIRVFTDDNMFISQDCRHLTKAGARFYAGILSLEEYLK